jgi:sugar (pentulose or hexulose) kinase
MQIIADVTQRDIWTVENPRIGGCLGAAMCGFVGAKVFPSFSEIKKFVKLKSYYKPNSANREIYNKLFKEYQTLYAVLQKPYEIANSGRF